MPVLQRDPSLLRGFRAGEPGALRRVFEAYRGEVLAMVRSGFEFSSKGARLRFTGARDTIEAAEIVQETFSRAFAPAARESYREENPYGPFLKQIARYVVLDRGRDKARWDARIVPIDEPTQVAATVSAMPSPERAVLDGELARLMKEFLDGLSEDDRALVRVRFEDEESQEDTAVRLGCTRNEVRKQIELLRKRLLRHLLRAGYIPTLDARQLFSLLVVL